MPKVSPKKAQEVKRQIQIIDRELYHLREIQRRYARRMLRAGTLIWVCGVIIFVVSVLISIGIESLTGTYGVWGPLLIIALSAPIVISAVFLRKLEKKEKHMEQMRKNLMEKFEQAMLKRVERMVKKS